MINESRVCRFDTPGQCVVCWLVAIVGIPGPVPLKKVPFGLFLARFSPTN